MPGSLQRRARPEQARAPIDQVGQRHVGAVGGDQALDMIPAAALAPAASEPHHGTGVLAEAQ